MIKPICSIACRCRTGHWSNLPQFQHREVSVRLAFLLFWVSASHKFQATIYHLEPGLTGSEEVGETVMKSKKSKPEPQPGSYRFPSISQSIEIRRDACRPIVKLTGTFHFFCALRSPNLEFHV